MNDQVPQIGVRSAIGTGLVSGAGRPGAFHPGLDFALSPSSTRRLIASGRDGLSPCAAAHPSMRDKGPGNNLTPIKVPLPVVRGRPRFFVLSLIDFGTIWVNTKLSGRPGAGTTQTALTQAKG